MNDQTTTPDAPTFHLRLPGGGYLSDSFADKVFNAVATDDEPNPFEEGDINAAMSFAREKSNLEAMMVTYKKKAICPLFLHEGVSLIKSFGQLPTDDHPGGILFGAQLITPAGYSIVESHECSLGRRLTFLELREFLAELPIEIQKNSTLIPNDEPGRDPDPQEGWYQQYVESRLEPDE